ncbi:MAG: hypothetical protein K1X83_09080 [Oligoflexia bacterium]|nr:hypothetical protein [Oligoflexia bacterium]
MHAGERFRAVNSSCDPALCQGTRYRTSEPQTYQRLRGTQAVFGIGAVLRILADRARRASTSQRGGRISRSSRSVVAYSA